MMIWKNIVEQGRQEMTIWRIRIASWIPTHSEYIIITDFPLQQWLHERSSVLRYTSILILVISYTGLLWFQREGAETQFLRKM